MGWIRNKSTHHSLLIWVLLGLWPGQHLQADIIDSLEELEKSKKPKNTEKGEEPPSQRPTGPVPSESVLEAPPEAPPAPPRSEVSTPSSRGSGDRGLNRRERRNLPIHLQSEGTSTYSQNGAMVHLQKNVVITQDDIRLQAQEAKVALQNGQDLSAVSSVEMLGKVSMSRYAKDPNERISARGDRAVFNNGDQIVILEGNARLWRAGHLIKGDRIVYEILTGMVKVDRVQGVVQPEKAGK